MSYIPDTAGARSAFDWAPADYGFNGWTYDPVANIQGGTLLASASGTLNLVKFKLAGTTITNLHMHFTTGATGAVAGQCLFALYSAAGVLFPTSVSADQSGNMNGGFKTFPLGTSQTGLTYGAYYYGAFFINVATTMPTISRALNSSSVITNPNLSAPNLRYATTADVGLTTSFPSTAGAQTGIATAFWMASS